MKVLVIQASPEEYISRGHVRKDLAGYDAVLLVREGNTLPAITDDKPTYFFIPEPYREAR